MRLTVIFDDAVIYLDGDALQAETGNGGDMHAIQWYGDRGHVEYRDARPNRELAGEDYAEMIAPYVAVWESARIARMAEEASAENEEEHSAPDMTLGEAETVVALFPVSYPHVLAVLGLGDIV